MGELDNHFCLVFSTKTGWTPYGPLLKSIVCFISFFLTFRTTLHYHSNTLVQTNVGKRHNNNYYYYCCYYLFLLTASFVFLCSRASSSAVIALAIIIVLLFSSSLIVLVLLLFVKIDA